MVRNILYTAFFLLTATISFAEEGHKSQAADMTYRFINFAVMAGALYFILAKPLRDYLASRSDSIKKALDEARLVREEAEKKLKDYQQKMEKLNADARELRDSLIDEGNKEKQKIIEEADKAAQRIKEQARFAAEQETKKARQFLKEEMANLLSEMAEERLKKELKVSDHERLVKEISAAGGLH